MPPKEVHKPKPHAIQARDAIYTNSDYDKVSKSILLASADHLSNQDWLVWMSGETLAAKTGLHARCS